MGRHSEPGCVAVGKITTMQLIRFLQNEEAATAVEYAVMLAMILLAVLSAVGAVGNKTGGMWAGIVNSVESYPTMAP